MTGITAAYQPTLPDHEREDRMDMTATKDHADRHDTSPSGRVMRWVVHSIETKRLVPGAPLPAQRQLAQQLGVSRTAVRAALERLADQGLVVDPVDGSRPHVAERRTRTTPPSNAAQRMLSDTIGILSNHRPGGAVANFPNNQLEPALAAVAKATEAAALHAMTVHPARLKDRGVETVATAGLKGMVVIDEGDGSPLVRDMLQACHQQFPVVVRGYGPESRKYDRVISDHEGGTAQLTRWLIAQSRRRILRLWHVERPADWLALRDVGYERAMREAGLDQLPAIHLPTVHIEGISEQASRDYARLYAGYLMEHLRGPEAIDAILVATDEHAFHVAAALRLLGLRPNEDVLVGGFDNLVASQPWAQWEPVGPIVTVDKNNPENGRLMIELLLQRIAGELPDEPQCRVTPATLVEVAHKETPCETPQP